MPDFERQDGDKGERSSQAFQKRVEGVPSPLTGSRGEGKGEGCERPRSEPPPAPPKPGRRRDLPSRQDHRRASLRTCFSTLFSVQSGPQVLPCPPVSSSVHHGT